MNQRSLDLFVSARASPEDEAFIASFRAARLRQGGAAATVSAEASQLRSLARDATSHLGLSLSDLLAQPKAAARLIEVAGQTLGFSTVLTRSRAVQKLAMQVLGDSDGRTWIQAFRDHLPKQPARGWHDDGLALPGTKTRVRQRAPTPDANAIEEILRTAALRSPVDGAIAGLVCFSGLDLKEMAELRWSEVSWHDRAGVPSCEVSVKRRGHSTTCFVVSDGTKALLRLALASGLRRESYLFPGRSDGDHLSTGAIRARLRATCEAAGWRGLGRVQLTSALVAWLKAREFSDHYIRVAIGRRRAATVDRLLRNHDSIAAQMLIDSRLPRGGRS